MSETRQWEWTALPTQALAEIIVTNTGKEPIWQCWSSPPAMIGTHINYRNKCRQGACLAVLVLATGNDWCSFAACGASAKLAPPALKHCWRYPLAMLISLFIAFGVCGIALSGRLLAGVLKYSIMLRLKVSAP